MAEREYVVVEPMRTANVYFVLASSREEAIEKANSTDCLWVEGADIVPTRPLRVRDARLVRNPRTTETEESTP